MRFDQPFQFVFAGFSAFMVWHVVRALHSGEWRAGKPRYRRRDHPVEYWFNVTFWTVAAAMFIWVVAAAQDQRWTRAWDFYFAGLIGLPAAFSLVRALQTGSVALGEVSMNRAEKPARFWLAILGHVLVVGFAGWMVTLWDGSKSPFLDEEGRPVRPQPVWVGPNPPTFYDEVEPVVAAVRVQLPGRQNGEFYNVRVDTRSRRVCGEVKRSDGKMLRFIGPGRDVGAGATLEDEALPTFSPDYARLCGGEPLRP